MVPWVVKQVQPGSIIIMHANGRGWHTAEALPAIIASLREQGYELVTISALLDLESGSLATRP
jgi:peptidoglycan/xylan/chitin deacetylase (PgdA/CDA1 family)